MSMRAMSQERPAANKMQPLFAHDDPAREIFTKAITKPGIHSWNDASERTHAEVLAAFDRAIEQCAVGDQSCDAARSEAT